MPLSLGAAGIMAGASLLGTGIQSYYNNKAAEREAKARREAASQLYRQG